MEYLHAWQWLADRLQNHLVTEDPSLWTELILQSKNQPKNRFSKKQVYLTGAPSDIFHMTDLFNEPPELDKVLHLTEKSFEHPALMWMDVHYYPPVVLNVLPEQATITIFVNDRLPVWARKLIVKGKVKQVVSIGGIMPLQVADEVQPTYIRASEFSYDYLLSESSVRPTEAVNGEQLFADIPNQLRLRLKKAEENQKVILMDDIAAYMLNEYWLMNKPGLHKWMPILIKEIAAFFEIRKSDLTTTELLTELETWGYRDKSINGS